MYRAVIVEDDELSQEALIDLLGSHFQEIKIVGVFDTISSSYKAIESNEVDIVFLDMELKDGKGFDLLERLSEINFEIIITTMHDNFMLEAIKHSAIDYIMKPVTRGALAESLKRLDKRLEKNGKGLQPISKSADLPGRMVIPNQTGLILIEIESIIRIQSDGPYSKIYLDGGESHLTSKNLGYYESQLGERGFFRVHHSHFVNLSKVKNYIRGTGGKVVMTDGTSVDVSKRKKDAFLQSLGFV
ncbi:MAG: response regulator transcription factor [Bacteroidia bacterium]